MPDWASRADHPQQLDAKGFLDDDPLRAAQSTVDAIVAA